MSLARQIRRLRKGKEATASRKRRKPIFEPLEPRLLLDADLSFGMTADADDLTLKLGKVGDVDKLQIINTNTSAVLDSLALSGSTEVEIIGSDEDDVLRLDLDFDSLLDSLSIVFQGGTGFDTLDFSSIEVNLAFVATQSGGVTVTDGEYTVNEDGTVSISGGTSTTTGSGVENIIGGKGDNTYVFEDGATLAGTVDGGTGGNNSLDYSAYSISNPVVVDLSAGIATGTGGVSHIQNVIGGLGDDTLTGNDGDNILSGGPGNDTLSGLGGEDLLGGDEGEDTLIGPEGDTLWEITGANEGSLNKEAEFSGIENLLGSANSQDGFVFFAEGSISGTITGGGGGSDGFIVEDPAEDGPFTIVNPDSYGEGTVTLYGKTINYAGIEPIVDASITDTVIIHGSVYDDVLVLEDKDPLATGEMQIRSASSDFFDANGGTFTSTLTFSNPTSSLVLKLGMGRDQLTIGALDPDFNAPVEVDGGSGFDTLAGPDGANAWNITGTNIGVLNGEVSFSSVENLTGASAQDNFVFADGADLDGTIDGGSGGPDTVDYSAASSDVTIALGVDVVHVDVLMGGSGSDTLIGLPDVTTWNITSPGGGTVITEDEDGVLIAEVNFSDFENLSGSMGDDSFLFVDGMGVQGNIDGGGGTNALDYSLYSAANSVTVDLGKGETTGAASFKNIQSVIGGNDADTLIGPEEESTWKITGADSGEVGEVTFAGFENLVGAPDNEDGFIIQIGGSLSGILDGGSGGSDSFAIEDPANAGSFTVIVPQSTGERTLIVNDIFAGDARTITYKGMEPSHSVDTTDPENIEIETSILAEDLVLESGPLAGQLQLRHVSGGTLPILFWDVAIGDYAGDTQVFDIPSGSITIDLRGGDDSLTISSIDTLGASLIIDTGGIGINAGALRLGGMVALGLLIGGPLSLLGAGLLIDLPMDDDDSVLISGDVLTGGGNIAIEAEDIRVASNVTLSTRDTLGGVTGQSVGDSGDLALIGHFINIESGASLLSYDNRDPSPDPLKIPAGIDNPSTPAKPWTPGMSYRDVATTSSGSGTGLTVNLITDTEGNPTVWVAARGTGYEDNETITVKDPDEKGDDITVQVNGLMSKGGDIVLRAERNRFSSIYETADASVTITDAVIHGRDVSIIAEADNDSIFDGDKNKGQEFFEGLLDLLANIRPLVGVSIVKATADVAIGEGTEIKSDGNVVISAHSNSEANIKTLGIAVGVGYGRSESDATVTLQNGVTINAAGDVTVGSAAKNTMQVDASAKKDIEAIPLDVMVAVSETYTHATTTVSSGSTITADGDVNVLSNSTTKMGTSAKSSGKFDMLGSAVVVAISEATSEAVVDGNVTATNGDVTVLANTTSTKNLVRAESLQGDNWFVTVNDWLDSTTPLKILKETGKKVWPPVKDWVSGLFKKESKKTDEKTEKGPEKEKTNWAEKYSKFGGAVAVAVAIDRNEATARIGSTADVESGRDVTVKADVVDRPDITASSVITAGTDVNKKTKEKKKVGKEYVGSVSVLVGDYTNHATAVIDSGAQVDARGKILVDSQTLIPYQLNWSDFIGVFEGKELKDLFDALKDIDIGPNGFVTSWATSAAEGNVAGIAGSVNVFIVDNASIARIGEGALINQSVDVPGQDVTVNAGIEFDSINLTGQFIRILKQTDPKKAKDKTSGIGGSFGGFFYDNLAQASIDSGAVVNADNLLVDAHTTTNNIVLGLAGGLPVGGEAAKFAVSGAVTVVSMNNHTLARIDDGAFVDADGTVDVKALDNVLNVNIVGGIVQGRSLGFGITAGINLIDRETKAIIGNQESVLGRGEFAPNTGVNDVDNTIDLGYSHGFTTGDAVVYSNGGGESIGGLTDGETYYVRVINSSTIRLARSIEEANENGVIFFSPDDVDDATNAETINLGYNHGYQTGDAVVYRNGGGESIGGLNDGQTYYIIRVSDTEVQLAELLDDALSETPFPVDLDLTLGGSGEGHRLHLDLDPLTSSGSSHSLGRGFDPLAAVAGGDGSINLGYEHGFTTGQKVTYSHGGGTSIGGLENKGTYYVIVVNPTTVRLAESRWQALEGTYVELDPSTAEGASHTIGAGFQARPVVDGNTDTIRFEGIHGFGDGQAIVYESGGGTPIGGLTSGDTYYVNSVDAHTIKLARSALEAQEDAVTFFGLDDLDNPGGAGTVIDLGYIHGFKTGDAVVYSNGGGESIGGLNEGQTYYVIHESETAIKLSKTADGTAFNLNTLQGSGTTHSLRLALDPAMATGTGHSLFEPDDVNGFISSGGKTTVSAENDGLVVTATIAAAKTGEKAPSKKDKNGKEGPGKGGTYGVALSGSFSANVVSDVTQAYISDSVIAQSNGVEVVANESTLIVAVSGAGALSTNQKGSFGLAGAVTVNYIGNQTLAYIHNSALEDIGTLTVRSEATGKIIGIAAGLSGATKGTGIAGSVGVNLIFGDTDAYVDSGSVITDATSVSITAKDTSSIIAVAGALAYGGKAGVGAGVAVNIIDGSTDAYVADSDVITGGSLTLSAENDSDILAIAAAIGASKGTMAAAVSVSVNLISNDTHAYLLGTKTDNGISAGGGISLTATDTSDIDVYAGGIALAFGRSGGDGKKKEGKSKAFTLGASIAVNVIDNDLYATIDAAKVNSAGNVELLATSTPSIETLTIAGAIAAAGGEGGGFSFAGAGAGSGNIIKNTVEAGIKNGSVVTTTGAGYVKLSSTDTSAITANAGGLGIAVAGGQGGGTALTAGVSVAVNDIENQVLALIDGSTVNSDFSVGLSATSSATIDALTIAGAIGAAGGQGKGFTFAGAGAGSGNTIKNRIEAGIKNGSVVTTANEGSVTLTAMDTSKIIADAGGVGIAAAGGQGGGTALTAGVSVAINDISNQVLALIDGSTVNSDFSVGLSATSSANIDALTIAAAIGASGGQGKGFTFAGAGAGSGNTIKNTVKAGILNDSEVTSANEGTVTLSASDTSKIIADAGGVGIAAAGGQGGGTALTAGVSVAINDIENQVLAVIDGSTVNSDFSVGLSATSSATIDAMTIAVAIGASGGQGGGFSFAGAGAGSGNTIKNTVKAAILNGSTVETENGGTVTLSASDTSKIIADAGGVGIAAAGGQGGGAALTAGVSVAINDIGNQVLAIVDNSEVTSASSVGLSATSSATIDAMTIAAAIGAAGGQGGGFSFAGAGAGSGNTIKNTVKAAISGDSTVTTTGTGGVSLMAKDTSKIIADAGGVGIAAAGGQGGGAAISAGVSVATNKIENQVTAVIDNSTVTSVGNVGLAAISSATIDALTIAGGIAAAGGQGGGFSFAGAGAGSGNTIKNTVKAAILNGSSVTTTSGAINLAGTDISKIIADAGGAAIAAAGGMGGGASISVGISIADNEIGNQVLAVIDASAVNSAAGVGLLASSSGTIDAFTFGGAVAISGGAGGGLSAAGSGSEASNWIHNTVTAAISNGSSVTTANTGSVILTATDSATITADAAGGSVSIAAGAGGAGAISIGAAIADNDINNIVAAYINNATVSSAGDVNLTATSTSLIDALSIAVSISAAVSPASLSFSGAGAEATNNTSSQILAYIDDIDDTTDDISTVTAKGSVNLSATDSSTAKADVGSGALNFGLVGASVGVSLSDNTINNTVKAYINNASVAAENGGISVTAGSTGFIDALAVATSVAISIGGAGAGGDADATITTGVESYAGSGAILTAGEDIVLTAVSDYDATADVYGVAVGMVAVGGSVATANANGAVIARMDGSVTKAHDLIIQASADNTADAEAFALAGGIFGGSFNDSNAGVSPTVKAEIGSGASSTAGGDVIVDATALVSAKSSTEGISAGLLAVGASYADSQVNSAVTASVGGTISAGNLSVTARNSAPLDSGYTAEAETTGSAGALVGVDATVSDASSTSTVMSYVADDSSLTIAGATTISATNSTKQKADACSNVGGLIAAGISDADASSVTVTEAYLGTNVKLTGGSLTITATGTDDNLADTTAGSFGLAGVASASAGTTTTSTTTAEVKDGSVIDVAANNVLPFVDGDTEATHTTDDGTQAVSAGQTVDVLPGHTGTGDVGTRYEYIGNYANYTTADGEREVNSNETVDVLSGFEGIGEVGNRYRYIGSDPRTAELGSEDFSDTDYWENLGAIRGPSQTIDLASEDFSNAYNWQEVGVIPGTGVFEITAEHTAKPNSKVKSLSGGLFGGAGAVADNTVTSTVRANVGDNAVVQARDLTIEAINHINKSMLSGGNIKGEAGGLIAGGGADSDTTISLTTLVSIGDSASLEVVGSSAAPGNFALRTLNDIVANEKVVLTAGGALSGLFGNAAIMAETDLARVEVGSADLKSVGAINVSARGQGEIVTLVEAEAYGAGTLITGTAESVIRPTNEIAIGTGAHIVAKGDLNLSAGTSTDFARDQYTMEVRHDSFAGSAIPLDDVDAKATLIQHNTIDIESGAVLETARSANLHTERLGLADMLAKAKAVNWMSSIADALNGAAAEYQYTGTSHAESHGLVQMDGTVRTGIERSRSLTLDDWDPNTGTIADWGTVNPTDVGIDFWVTREKLESDLAQELDDARASLALYEETNATLAAYYKSEITRLEGLLAAEGLLTYSTITIKNHGFNAGDAVEYHNTGTGGDIGGLVDGDTYYVITQEDNPNTLEDESDPDLISLASSAADAAAKNRINMNSVGASSSHSMTKTENGIPIGATKNFTLDDLGGASRVEQYVMTVHVAPVWAEAGNIDVRADVLQGLGTFEAPGDPSVTILNHTPAFLVVHGITIPENNGGLFFTGDPILDKQNVIDRNAFNIGLDALTPDFGEICGHWGAYNPEDVAFSELPPDPSEAEPPSITILNDFEAGTLDHNNDGQQETYPWPDITVVGDIDNLGGDVSLATPEQGEGDVLLRARVRAQNLTIVAGGALYVDGVTDFAVGGEPYKKYDAVTTGKITSTYDPDGSGPLGEITVTSWYPGIAAATQAQAIAVANKGFAEEATVYADKIFINAEYLNINGLIQSGKGDYNLVLGTEIANKIKDIESAQMTGLVSLSLNDNSDFMVRYDTVSDQIVVNEMRVSGGKIEMTGHILNTGTGEIRVLGGYANINITNTTPYDLVLNRLDASQRGAGTLVIVDKGKGGSENPTATIYRSSGSGITRTIDDGTGPVVAQLGGNTDTYTPEEGWRYGWSIGVETFERSWKHVQSSSWFGIDAFAKDPDNIKWDTTEVAAAPRLMDEGPYYYYQPDTDPDTPGIQDPAYTHSEVEQTLSAMKISHVSHWTTSNWCGVKTYHDLFVGETYQRTIDTHTVEADRPFTVRFVGSEEGQVTVTSESNVVLKGPIVNPSGTTAITSKQGSIEQVGEAPYVSGKRIDLSAKTGIGGSTPVQTSVSDEPVYQHTTDSLNNSGDGPIVDLGSYTPSSVFSIASGDRVKLAAGYSNGGVPGAVYKYKGSPAELDLSLEDYEGPSWEPVDHWSSLEATTTAGQIRIAEIIGNLPIDKVVASSGGDVTLSSHGRMEIGRNSSGALYEGLIEGGAITLTAGGDVGSSGHPLVLESGNLLKDRVSVTAEGGVYLKEKTGDLRLEQITAAGAVEVEVMSGSILDANQEENRDERSVEKLRAGVWGDLQLTVSTGANEKIDGLIDSYAAKKEQEYETYWKYRKTQPDDTVYDPTFEVTLSTTEKAAYENQLGYGEDEIAALEASRTEQYHTLHGQYGGYGDVYDPDFDYTPSAAEEDAIRDSVKVWTEEELLYAVGAGLLKPVSDTTITFEDPNIVGTSVTLTTHSGGVGDAVGYQAIDLTPPLTLTEDQRIALAAAERDDLVYLGPSISVTAEFSAAGNSITRTDGGSWLEDGFTPRMRLELVGSVYNDTAGGLLYEVQSVSDSELTLTSEADLTNETGVNVTITPEALTPTVFTTVDFADSGSADTITRKDGKSWLNDRFSAGMRIRVMGVTDNANEAGTFYTIAIATEDTLTLTSDANLANETDVNVTIAPEITKIIVIEREDVDVSATEAIVIDADTSVYLGSGKYQNAEYDLNLNSVKAGTTIRIKADKAIYNWAGSSATNIQGGNLILEAAGGPIGGPDAIDKLYTDLAPSVTIAARAQDDIYIVERGGNMNVETMFSEMGGIYLEAQDSIVDGLDHDFTKIAANHVELTATTGTIGESGDYLEVDVGGSGTLIAHAEGSIWIHEKLGDMNVEHVESYAGDVDLRAHLFILDPADSLLPEIIGNSITLIADIGGLGLSANPLEIDSGHSGPGTLTSSSEFANTYIVETDGSASTLDDLSINEVSAGAGYTAFITAPEGSILNGRTDDGPNVVSGKTYLVARDHIGEELKPLGSEVGNIEGKSILGSTWVANMGPLTIGGVMEGSDPGLLGGGSARITATSPITVTKDMIYPDEIILTAGDRAGAGDDLVVAGGVRVQSENSYVELRAGDTLLLEPGSVIEAAGPVTLICDFESADPEGGVINPQGQIIAASLEIFGQGDDDVFALGRLSKSASVSGGEGTDTLIGPDGPGNPDGDNSWEILGLNTGNLNEGFISFTDVESLTGGSGNDTFYFRGLGEVEGIVDGGDGFDILDFLQSDFIQDAAASFLVTDLPTVGDDPVDFAKTGGIVHIEDILVILLAEVQEDGTLVLNMGPRAAERLAINTVDGDEEFILTHVAGDPVAEEAETIGVEAFGIYLEYEGVRAIQGSGGLGDDTIFLSGDVLAPAELDGGPGNDLLVGGAGDDVLRGGEGDDILEGGAGNDVMDGGWGDDHYVLVPGSLDKVIDAKGVDTLDFSGALLGVKVNLNEVWGQTQWLDSAGNKLRIYGMIENAVGSEFDDWIYGNWLNNTLEGLGGDDWLFGSSGDDTLEGGDGRDRLYGDWGNDRLAGGAGDDYIEGGYGEDLLFFPGALTGVIVNLTCGGNGWSTDGLGGVDTLRWSIEGAVGTEFDDTLVGDNSGNVFYGMAGNDFIDGRGGDDVLYDGEGDDTIFAGSGNDLVVWTEEEGRGRIHDTIDMGDGWDRVRMTTGDADDYVYLSRAAKNQVQILGAGFTEWSLSVTKGDIFEIYTGGGADIVAVGNLWCTDVDEVVLYLGSGNDKVDGSLTNVSITAYGQAGNDLFIGGWGKDTFDGGEGSDWVDYSSAPRSVHVDLTWGASQDGKGSKDYLKSIENVIGTPFDDMIWGTEGANIIRALGGGDQVWARGGDDVVYGGEGDDKLWGDDGNDTLMGDDGNDMLWGGRGDDQLYGGAGNDRLWGDGGDDKLFGDAGDDHLEGGDGEDRLEGGDGHDELDGGRGNDQLFGGAGNDRLEGGHGDDLLKGDSGNDVLDGGWGDDRLYGGEGDDRLYGGWGDDELFGEDGNDLLVGDHGDDMLDGGAGVNKLVDWPDKHKDCGDHGHGPFDKAIVSPCCSWVSDFVNDLCRDSGKNNPNGKIKITLPVIEEKKPGSGCKGGKN